MDKLERFTVAYAELTAVLTQIPQEAWQFKPEPERWSIHEIVVHIADNEAYIFIRIRLALATPGADYPSLAQDTWAQRLNYHAQDANTALEMFRHTRQLSVDLLRETPIAAWQNTLAHPRRGAISLDEMMTFFADHIRVHITQIEAVYAAWQATQSKT